MAHGGGSQLPKSVDWESIFAENGSMKTTVRRYEALSPDYEITAETWERAIRLADRGRATGVTAPLADLLIFACAKLNDLEIAHDDEHFDALAKLEA